MWHIHTKIQDPLSSISKVVNSEIRHLIEHARMLRCKLKHKLSPSLHIILISEESFMQKMRNKPAHYSYLWNIIHSSISDSMKLFSLLRHQSRKSCIPQTLNTAAAFITHSEDKANDINWLKFHLPQRMTSFFHPKTVCQLYTNNSAW